MKLVKQYSSSRYAELDALALQNQGILTHVSSKHSYDGPAGEAEERQEERGGGEGDGQAEDNLDYS